MEKTQLQKGQTVTLKSYEELLKLFFVKNYWSPEDRVDYAKQLAGLTGCVDNIEDGEHFEFRSPAIKHHVFTIPNECVSSPLVQSEQEGGGVLRQHLILDACCGGRMFWYDKENPDAIFMDERVVEPGAFANNWNPGWCVNPDVVADFRKMPFPDNHFKMVVFDPPHLTSGSMKSVINKKYGLLNPTTWKQDIIDGFTECYRVVEDCGIVVFKWNEANIKARDLIKDFPVKPLFGDFTGKTGKTIWMTFMKIPVRKPSQQPDQDTLKPETIELIKAIHKGAEEKFGEKLEITHVSAAPLRKEAESPNEFYCQRGNECIVQCHECQHTETMTFNDFPNGMQEAETKGITYENDELLNLLEKYRFHKGPNEFSECLSSIRKFIELSSPIASKTEITAEYQIDFGNNLRCGIKVIDGKIEVIGAVNGWGDGVPETDITITRKTAE